MAEITDFGPRKTIFILAIVAGCFAVLWPKIFYPMLTASVSPHHSSDNSACCDVIFESDVTAADIMYEICQNILKHHQVDPRVRDAFRSNKLTPQSVGLCREEILARCGIDLSSFLAERERLGKSYKQVLEEIRSFNSSLCLKIHFGIPLSQLGTPHLIRYHILMPHSTIRQERRTPPHAGGLHPALRERGRAIPSSHIVPKVVDRPDHVIPKMRPPLGGGHVVPTPKGNGTMGIIMPLYTLGIVLFFLYTIVKVLKKSSDNEIISEYPGAAAEKEFRKMVFSPEALATAMTGGSMRYPKERSPSPYRPPPTIEELKDLDGAPKSNGLAGVNRSSKEDTTGQDTHSRTEEEVENLESSPTVKVMGMEMTASCEGGQKGSRPTTPIIPTPPSHAEREKTPPKPIYLEGALPPQCELLVTDSETQAQKAEEDAEAPVVLSGKMTLSLISLDQIAAEDDEEIAGLEEARNTADDNAGRRLLDFETIKNPAENEVFEGGLKIPGEKEEEVGIPVFQADTDDVRYEHDDKAKFEMTFTEARKDESAELLDKDQEVRVNEEEVEIAVGKQSEEGHEEIEGEETEEEQALEEAEKEVELEAEVEEEEVEIETDGEEEEEEVEIEVEEEEEEEEEDEEEEVEVEVEEYEEEDDDENEDEELTGPEDNEDSDNLSAEEEITARTNGKGTRRLPYSEKVNHAERN